MYKQFSVGGTFLRLEGANCFRTPGDCWEESPWLTRLANGMPFTIQTPLRCLPTLTQCQLLIGLQWCSPTDQLFGYREDQKRKRAVQSKSCGHLGCQHARTTPRQSFRVLWSTSSVFIPIFGCQLNHKRRQRWTGRWPSELYLSARNPQNIWR